MTNRMIKDSGYLINLKALNGRVQVGWFAPNASYEVIKYAYYTEMGTPTQPARPMVKRALLNRTLVNKYLSRHVDRMLSGYNKRRSLMYVGISMKHLIQREIATAQAWAKPIKLATALRKGHDRPLFDSGVLYETINYRVL